MCEEIPMNCSMCGHDNMVAVGNLDKRPFDQVISLLGYECENCGGWETVSVETAVLKNLIQKIERMPVTHQKFPYMMGKAIRKVQNLMKKVRNSAHAIRDNSN